MKQAAAASDATWSKLQLRAATSGASWSKVKLLKMQPESSYSDYYKYMAINDYFPNFEVVARSSCTKHVQTPRFKVLKSSSPIGPHLFSFLRNCLYHFSLFIYKLTVPEFELRSPFYAHSRWMETRVHKVIFCRTGPWSIWRNANRKMRRNLPFLTESAIASLLKFLPLDHHSLLGY